MMGLIRRVFTYLDTRTFRYLYVALVRSVLENNQVVWYPVRKGLVKRLEEVQMRATKLIDGFQDMEYSDRLKALNIPTLHYRRIRGDMIECWNHFNKHDPAIISPSFQRNPRPNRRHNCQLQQLYPRITKYVRPLAVSFYHRVPRLWNRLPKQVISAENLDTFKNRLNRHWHNADFVFDWWSPPPETPEGYTMF
jgi:hypothetical protein